VYLIQLEKVDLKKNCFVKKRKKEKKKKRKKEKKKKRKKEKKKKRKKEKKKKRVALLLLRYYLKLL
jgi:hypothetical protein